MRAILALAAALATFAPVAFASAPTTGDVLREWNRAMDLIAETVDFADAEILTDVEGAEIGGSILMEGTATADPGFEIAVIRFYVDHTPVGDAKPGETWAFELDTRRFLDGAHAFSVRVAAAPVTGDVHVFGWSGGDSVAFRTLNHVVGVVLHEATYEGLDARTHLWSTELDRDYVGLKMTVTTTPDPEGLPIVGAPLLGQAVAAYHEDGEPESEPTKTWVASFGLLSSGAATVMSKPPHDLLKEGSTLALAGQFVGDGTITIRIEAIAW
ncbi:MAG TPA: hypothetical protein VHH36_06185 [Candidatus Thermoplasmatota archaeon]|nr:hypothetical protein [Candidatus Thermoplasmatota archaeon]